MLFEWNQRCRPTFLITSLFFFFFKWVFLTLGNPSGGAIGQGQINWASTLMNKNCMSSLDNTMYVKSSVCFRENVATTRFNRVLIFLEAFEGAGWNPEIKSFLNTFFEIKSKILPYSIKNEWFYTALLQILSRRQQIHWIRITACVKVKTKTRDKSKIFTFPPPQMSYFLSSF